MKIFIPLTAVALLIGACSSDKASGKKESQNNTANDSTQTTTMSDTNTTIPYEEAVKPVSSLAIATPSLKESLAFYTKLGFRVVFEDSNPYPFAWITDSSVLIGLFEDGGNWRGMTLWTEDHAAAAAEWEGAGFILDTEDNGPDMSVVLPPDSMIGIAFSSAGNPLPEMKLSNFGTLMKHDQLNNPEAYVNPNLGAFGEYALPVKELQAAFELWKAVGWEGQIMEYGEPYAIMQKDQLVVGLHQTEEFTSPGITYFCKEAAEKAKNLQDSGITSIEPMGSDDMENASNFIITTPENQSIFLFGMP